MIADCIAGPRLHLNQVTFQVGQQLLLEGIDCTFESGKWYGIAGPNGGGKSTLIKTILGLNNHQGEIEIHWPSTGVGQRRIGYIPQLMPFDDSLPISVRDYLLMSLSSQPIWFKRKLPSEVLEALEFIQLRDKLERRIGDLSGGERQRLMLTTALLQKPGLLILDEPMTGLDAQGKNESLQILERFKDAGGTLLMIEHDWDLIQRHCDQIFWVDRSIRSIEGGLEHLASSNMTRIANEVFKLGTQKVTEDEPA